MDLDRIEALLKLMHEYQVAELTYEADETKLQLRLADEQARPVPVARAQLAAAPPPGPAPTIEADGDVVRSPIVGTFYRAPKPGAAPYVEVGSRVNAGQVLCIVEAMKLMNEIESEVAGTVAEIFVGNAEPVQFNQPLFRIVPG